MEIVLDDFHDSFSPGEAISRCARTVREAGPYAVMGGYGRKNIDTQILSTLLQNFVESGGKTEE